ncbi:unnamed protein product [Symbiodinium microadriaticum]|nr:unnamed protein product [Symbiodinium microadriaticum]
MADKKKTSSAPQTERRKFLTGAAAGGAVLAAGAAAGTTALPAPAYAKGKRRLKMVTTWPKNFPGLGFMAERMSKRIDEMTDGQIKIKVFAAGELVPAMESFDAVSRGTADIYHGADYYWQGKSLAFNFFTAVPMGLSTSEMNAWIYHGGGQELWDELSAKFNIKPFAAGNSGVQLGGWFRKEINSLEDYKGLKFRMPGLGGEVLRRLGATALTLPGGEIFPALQSGAIDGTEWVGPWNDLAFGFYKAENDYSYAEYNARNGAALKTLIDKHGVQLRKMSPEILAEIGRLSGQVVREAAEKDDITRRVFESYMAARTDIGEWNKIADQAYWEAVAWLAVFMVLAQFIVVLMRYVFGLGSIAAQESIVYMHGFLFMLAAGYTLFHNGHVRVDVFYRAASDRYKAWINLLGALLFLLPFCYLIFDASWGYVLSSWEIFEGSRETSGIQAVFLLKTAIPLFAVLVGLQGLSQIIHSIAVLRGDETLDEEQPLELG